jgi:centromere protein I
VPSKKRYTDAGQLAKTIASNAYESGINPSALERLIHILTRNNHLDQGTITTLIKNLYPIDRISSKVVTQVVCCLGPSKDKPSPATQASLLRWLILVYEFCEDRSHLAKLYAVLFNHLDMISLRKPLCHLLSMITRRKYVKPFRIQALMELVNAAGAEEKELIGLLNVFKNYYPDIIVGDLGALRRRGLVFKHPDPEWTSHARLLQDRNLEQVQAVQSSSFQVVHRGAAKRGKMEVIVPVLQTSRVSSNRTSLEELRSVDHLVEKLERIELPNQIISAMADNMAQKYLYLAQPESARLRLDDWLSSFFDERLENAQDEELGTSESLGYILSLVMNYVRYTKVCLLGPMDVHLLTRSLLQDIPASVQSFLRQYLSSWNGRDNKEEVLSLLEYLPIQDFDTLRTDFLSPLEAAILGSGPFSMTVILDFYSSLIRQWGVRLRASPPVSAESKPSGRLITHAELLALSILESLSVQSNTDNKEPRKPAALSVLEFYCVLADLFSYASVNGQIRLTIPLAPTVYTLVFTPILSSISIISSVLASYKMSFETSLTSEILQVPNSTDSLYPTELVGQFNGYVMDVCNLVWRNRGLNGDDPNALGCLLPAATTSALTQYTRELNEASRDRKREASFFFNLSSIFSLSYHVALCNMSAGCFADIEEENDITEGKPRLRKPVTQKALSALEKDGGVKLTWQEYRVRMLDWLDATGSRGIGNLMRSTMKALRKE